MKLFHRSRSSVSSFLFETVFRTVYRMTFNLSRRRSRIPRAQDFYLFRTYSSRNKNQSYAAKIGRICSLFLENFFLSFSLFLFFLFFFCSFCGEFEERSSISKSNVSSKSLHESYVYNCCSSSRDSLDSCTKKRNLARFLNLTFVCATHFPHLFVYIQKKKWSSLRVAFS